jgi:hypothetical protein
VLMHTKVAIWRCHPLHCPMCHVERLFLHCVVVIAALQCNPHLTIFRALQLPVAQNEIRFPGTLPRSPGACRRKPQEGLAPGRSAAFPGCCKCDAPSRDGPFCCRGSISQSVSRSVARRSRHASLLCWPADSQVYIKHSITKASFPTFPGQKLL